MHTLTPTNFHNNDARSHIINATQRINKDAHNYKETKDNITHEDDAEPNSHSNTSRSAPPKRLSATIANEWVILQKSAGPLDPLGTQQQPILNNPPARRVRNIRQQDSTSSITGEHNTTIEQAQETLDPESTYYIQEIIDSWNQVNHVIPIAFMKRNPSGIDASLINEIWIKTKSNNIDIEWFADTGSPKSFINEATATAILQKCNKAKRLPHNQEPKKYRCFNNVSIPIIGIHQLDLTSGDWTSRDNKILIVQTQTVNLLGRDVLSKLGFSLTLTKGKQINHISTELQKENIRTIPPPMHTNRKITEPYS